MNEKVKVKVPHFGRFCFGPFNGKSQEKVYIAQFTWEVIVIHLELITDTVTETSETWRRTM